MTFRNNQVMSRKVLQSCTHNVSVRVVGKILCNVTSTTRSGQQRGQDEFLVTCYFVFAFMNSKTRDE